MNFKTKLITIGIAVILTLVLIGLGITLKNQNDKIKVLKQNNENLAQIEQSYTVKLIKSQQNRQALRRMFSKQSAVLDSLKTKWKHVPEISTVYLTNTDTVIDTVHMAQIIPMMPDLDFQSWEITDGCFGLSGKSYFDFTIERKSYTDTLFIVQVSGERRRLFGWKWTPYWGHKKADTVKTWSNCGDVRAIIVEKINK